MLATLCHFERDYLFFAARFAFLAAFSASSTLAFALPSAGVGTLVFGSH